MRNTLCIHVTYTNKILDLNFIRKKSIKKIEFYFKKKLVF